MLRKALLLSAVLALSGPVGISTQANANFTPYESSEARLAEAVAQAPAAATARASIKPKYKAKRKAVASLGYRKAQWTHAPYIHGVTY
jgi:hypothetical protein